MYTRYSFYLGTCTFVHGSLLLLYNMHIYNIYVTTVVCVCRTMFVCMALTTGQGCQSCSWSAAERKINYSLSSFAPENLVSRVGFGGPIPRQLAHLHTESSACLRDSSRVPRRRPFIIGTHYVLWMQQCVCFFPIHSGHPVRWTYQPGSHRRKVTQDFSSTFFLRCVPSFFSREGFSHSFPSSTVKSNFVY